MSDDPKNKSDITRIEDLEEFEHDEEDLDDDLEEFSFDESIDESEDQNEDLNEDDLDAEDDLDTVNFDEFEEQDEYEDLENDKPNNYEEQDNYFEETPHELSSDDSFLEFDDEISDEPSKEDQSQQLEATKELETASSDIQAPDNVTETIFEPSKDITEISTSLNAISYGELPSPGNPPYSIKMTQIKYHEDTEFIIQILKEYHLINDDNKDDYLLSLQKGTLLIPRISEFLAITLANKLRVIQADMVIGLAHEIQTSELFNETERGLISKSSVNMNYEKNSAHQSIRTTQDDIMLATTAIPAGYHIEQHLGIATETTLLDMSQFPKESENLSETFEVLTESGQRSHPLSKVYSKLSQNLKHQAFKQFGNGIVNLKYEVHPIVSDADPRLHYYQVVCTGDIVVLSSAR